MRYLSNHCSCDGTLSFSFGYFMFSDHLLVFGFLLFSLDASRDVFLCSILLGARAGLGESVNWCLISLEPSCWLLALYSAPRCLFFSLFLWSVFLLTYWSFLSSLLYFSILSSFWILFIFSFRKKLWFLLTMTIQFLSFAISNLLINLIYLVLHPLLSIWALEFLFHFYSKMAVSLLGFQFSAEMFNLVFCHLDHRKPCCFIICVWWF